MDTRNILFRLRFRVAGKRLEFTAFDAEKTLPQTGHSVVYVRATHAGETILNGGFWVGIPYNQSIDGNYARRAVAHTLTGTEGLEDNAAAQSWAAEHGEELHCLVDDRFGEWS